MTYNKMKYWIQKNNTNEAEQYAGIHKNINENEPYDINETELDENKVAYVSNTRVSTEGSYLK